jgi:hypothetical protein
VWVLLSSVVATPHTSKPSFFHYNGINLDLQA